MPQSIFSNSIWLTITKAAKFLTPLLILPYLIQKIGFQNVGLIAFAEAISQTILVISDYGFPLSATKQVSIKRDSEKSLRSILSSIVFIKSIIFAFVFLFLLILLALNIYEEKIISLYFLMSFMLLGNMFTFAWFFQGIEDSRALVLSQLCSSLVTISGIYFFVKSESDFLFAPLFYAIGSLLGGLISQLYVLNFIKWKLEFKFDDIIHQLKDGFVIFIAYLSMSSYSNLNVILLGLLTNNFIVAQYKIILTIVNAAAEVLSPISASVYARLVFIRKNSHKRFTKKFKNIYSKILPLYISISLILLIAPLKVASLLGYTTSELDIVNLRLLSPFPVIQCFCTYGTIYLIVIDKNISYLNISIKSLLLSIPISIILIYLFGIKGSIYAYIITTSYVFISYWREILFSKKGNETNKKTLV